VIIKKIKIIASGKNNNNHFIVSDFVKNALRSIYEIK